MKPQTIDESYEKLSAVANCADRLVFDFKRVIHLLGAMTILVIQYTPVESRFCQPFRS